MEPIKYYNGEQLKSLKIDEPNDIIKGLIRETSLSMLVGEEGCGKSIFAMNLALAIATGQDSFLGYKIMKHGKVLYLNNELPFGECLSRFKKMIHLDNLEKTSKIDDFIIPDRIPDFSDYKIELDYKCGQMKPILVILDCLYWAHNSNENDNSEMKNILRQLMHLRDTHHLAILVIHHTKKGTKSEPMHNDNIRGASVLAGASDSILQLKRSFKDEELRLFKPTKLRYANDEMKKAKLLSLDPDNLWFVDQGETDEKDHMLQTEHRETAQNKILWDKIIKKGEAIGRDKIIQRTSELGFTDRTIDRELKSAVETKTIKKVGHGKYSI